MTEKYYKEEIARIDELFTAKRELILCTLLEAQGLKQLKECFEQKLEEMKGGE